MKARKQEIKKARNKESKKTRKKDTTKRTTTESTEIELKEKTGASIPSSNFSIKLNSRESVGVKPIKLLSKRFA